MYAESEFVVAAEAFWDVAERRIQALHSMYSARGMAASLESLRWFLGQCREGETIVECGAGLSTWIFRRFWPSVITIEEATEKAHLDVVTGVCRTAGVNVDHFYLGFVQAQPNAIPQGDCTFCDIGNIRTRSQYLQSAWSLTQRLMYVDDADRRPLFAPIREATIAFAETVGAHWRDCPEAEDEHGRWGILLTKSEDKSDGKKPKRRNTPKRATATSAKS